MEADEFFKQVQRRANLDSTEEARTVTEATLQTLGERITEGQADDLAERLPSAVADALVESTPSEAAAFGVDEFVDRVSERTGADESTALEWARAVMDVLSETTGPEFQDAREQLPPEYDLVLERALEMDAEEFLERVRTTGELDSMEAARAATEATLETLGERITVGQAEDLATYLPEEFKPSLVEEDRKEVATYDVEEFVDCVSERSDVDEEAAAQQVRAVTATLAAAAGEEFEDALDQLPAEYGRILGTDEGE